MNNYEKIAEGDWSVPQRFLMSALVGGGSFGAMRLLTDILNRINKPKVEDNSLKLMMNDPMDEGNKPEEAIPKFAEEKTATWSNDLIAMGVGLPAGFLGTKYLYDSYSDHQAQQKIDVEKKKYLAQLQSIKEETAKQASETPCIDGFCEVLAEQLNKEADDTVDPGIARGWVSNWREIAADPVKFPEGRNEMNWFYRKAVPSKLYGLQKDYAGNPAGIAGQTAKVLFALGLGGVFGGLVSANNTKREKERKLMYPNKVTYA